ALTGRTLAAAARPQRALGQARSAAEAMGEVAWAALNPAPATPLNVPIGPYRRLEFVRKQLDDFKRAKRVLGGTVNDVILAVVAGALRSWLRAHDVRTEGLE